MIIITLGDIISLIGLGIALIIAVFYYIVCKIEDYKYKNKENNNGN